MATPGEKRQYKTVVEAVRSRMRIAAEASGLTQEEIGVKMGFSRDCARQAVSRLLNAETYDPRLSTLVAFANAVGKPLKDLA
ncbi:MAG TPA: helix-turn-helix transcriptional regulator [Planctomycetaceae bacterium]|jgi:transcriptional regulator with XRE-family HTH domain|nr:helix-turn-helix transcriptional regulator [Planctomycetaceae bacterium]